MAPSGEQMAPSLRSELQLCPGSSSIQPVAFRAPMCTLLIWAIRQKFVCAALENETSVKCTLWERAFYAETRQATGSRDVPRRGDFTEHHAGASYGGSTGAAGLSAAASTNRPTCGRSNTPPSEPLPLHAAPRRPSTRLCQCVSGSQHHSQGASPKLGNALVCVYASSMSCHALTPALLALPARPTPAAPATTGGCTQVLSAAGTAQQPASGSRLLSTEARSEPAALQPPAGSSTPACAQGPCTGCPVEPSVWELGQAWGLPSGLPWAGAGLPAPTLQFPARRERQRSLHCAHSDRLRSRG